MSSGNRGQSTDALAHPQPHDQRHGERRTLAQQHRIDQRDMFQGCVEEVKVKYAHDAAHEVQAGAVGPQRRQSRPQDARQAQQAAYEVLHCHDRSGAGSL